jgi:hypothetical protein
MSGSRILFYTMASGNNPIDDFLAGIRDVKARAFCVAFMQRLISPGPPLARIHAEHVRGRLWELKPSFRGIEFRFLYA